MRSNVLIIFIKILRENKNNDYILKNILILAQTFYKLENGEKIYIQESLKNDVLLYKKFSSLLFLSSTFN